MSQLALEERVLVLTPTGADARISVRVLRENGFLAQSFPSMEALCEASRYGVGALLIAEEALTSSDLSRLSALMASQPSWSDFAVVMVTSGAATTQYTAKVFSSLMACGNITLIERPFRLITLVSAMQGALRARRRQYQVRALLSQHENDQQELRAHTAELERRVAERTAKLSEMVSELEAFSYTVSHDLRAPLRGIQGYAHFLLEDGADRIDETTRDYVRHIQASAARLDALVRDVLAYSRVSRSEMSFHAIDLEMLVQQIVAENPTFRMPHAEINLERPLSPVRGHAPSLSQCIANLLGNAIKFVEPGLLPRVTVRTESVGEEHTRVWFEDNGIGIDPDLQGKIFGMFERGHPDRTFDGTGIGLAIVKKAVLRMRGDVGVFSTPGQGSRFWIQLPRA
ncbi:MAG TPA: HAMP domain-containing sensor histidine kinase [Opitutaceae bacterium]|nr:HAMP domain-containing sensor histidine kinase [Opitutaceae bacterium]